MAEFYIRQPDAEEARGPFTEEQLESLGEARQITPDTLFYDPQKEVWLKIGSDGELKNRIFPERKSLSLKPRGKAVEEAPPEPKDAPAAVRVDEMLAAAEGNTSETKHVVAAKKSREKAASLSVPVAILIMAMMIISAVFPSIEIVQEIIEQEAPSLLIEEPLLIVALIDTFLLICLCLAVTEIFPIVRVRAMMGLGFFAFYYWAQGYNGDPQGYSVMAASLAANLGLYLCTLSRSYFLSLLAALLGVAGSAAFAYFMVVG